MGDPAKIAAGLTEAVNRTNDELMNWAISPANSGPLSREAHHICVHITSSLRLLEGHFRAILERTEHD